MPYQQIQYLGGGQFGDVWLEQDEALDRLCAAKHLDTSLLAPGTESFAEARAMVAAEHANVVVVYSAELESGEPVIRMEYLPDGSVTDKYGSDPIAVAEAVRIMEDACRGVEHLHVRGILHRDIKPGNLLVAPSGAVKVSDFGLSCPISGNSTGPLTWYNRHLPPEDVGKGTGISAVAGDVYAAGVTAYRLLNGDQALKGIITPGVNPMEFIAKGKYPNRKYWLPHIHPRLRRAVVKAMHVDPAKRYADARTFRRALEQARPYVSWWPTQPATGFGWEGASANGTTWRAAIEPKTKGGFRFTVERRLPGKAWRKQNVDGRDTTSVQTAADHAHEVLSRIAAKGA
jgi:serine/threonine-protein kinase